MRLAQTVFNAGFQNPLLTASGKWSWTAAQCRSLEQAGAGGIVTKSYSTYVHRGHSEPIVVRTEHYTLNAVGLPADGFAVVRDDLSPYLPTRTVPVILSIFGDTVERFSEAAKAYAELGADAIELNISCPNVQQEHGLPFSYDEHTAAAAVRAARTAAPSIPLIVKLSPNVPDIARIALACAEAGCDGYTLVNTLGPGMAIDLHTRTPILSNRVGGVSGPAVKPIAVRCIAEVFAATEGRLPIIGAGGVQSGLDAIELMIAGASLVAMGTSVLWEGETVFGRLRSEIEAWCEEEGVEDIAQIVGSLKR